MNKIRYRSQWRALRRAMKQVLSAAPDGYCSGPLPRYESELRAELNTYSLVAWGHLRRSLSPHGDWLGFVPLKHRSRVERRMAGDLTVSRLPA